MRASEGIAEEIRKIERSNEDDVIRGIMIEF